MANVLQHLPEFEPPSNLWHSIKTRISPRPKLPSSWMALACTALVVAIAISPAIQTTYSQDFPAIYVELADLVHENEQLKLSILAQETVNSEADPIEEGLRNHINTLDAEIYGDSGLSRVERKDLLERQMNALRSLQYVQMENSLSVRRVSY